MSQPVTHNLLADHPLLLQDGLRVEFDHETHEYKAIYPDGSTDGGYKNFEYLIDRLYTPYRHW